MSGDRPKVNVGVIALEGNYIEQFIETYEKGGNLKLCGSLFEFNKLKKFKPPTLWKAVIVLLSEKEKGLTDKTYGPLLKNLCAKYGKNMICVIAYDFTDANCNLHLSTLKKTNAPVFKHTQHVIICDKLDSIQREGLDILNTFFDEVDLNQSQNKEVSAHTDTLRTNAEDISASPEGAHQIKQEEKQPSVGQEGSNTPGTSTPSAETTSGYLVTVSPTAKHFLIPISPSALEGPVPLSPPAMYFPVPLSPSASTNGISDLILNEIVNEVGADNDTVNNLGFSLGFSKVNIDKYDASNHLSGKVSFVGTRNMLFEWQRRTSPLEQIGNLREALIKAKLMNIADKHL